MYNFEFLKGDILLVLATSIDKKQGFVKGDDDLKKELFKIWNWSDLHEYAESHDEINLTWNKVNTFLAGETTTLSLDTHDS